MASIEKTFAHAYKYGQPVNPSKQALDNIADFIYNQYYDYCDNGVTFEFVDYEPYSCAGAMLHQFTKNNHLKVSTLHNESVFPPETNLLFRAVHDMHHLQLQAGFDMVGEYDCAMYAMRFFLPHSEESKILFSEIALQAAFALYFGEFALEQKVVFV